MTEPQQKPGTSKQDYETPWELIHAVESRFGKFSIDLAARRDNAKAPACITPETDSLKISWYAKSPTLCWLNPPFADIAPWAAKCKFEVAFSEHLRIIMLTPASVGSNWFAEHVHKKAWVLALSPRLTFVGAEQPYPKDCMLSLYGFGKTDFDVWRWNTCT